MARRKLIDLKSAISKEVSEILANRIPKITEDIKRALEKNVDIGFSESSEVASMKSGRLRAELGLQDAESKLDRIKEAIKRDIQIEVKLGRRFFIGPRAFIVRAFNTNFTSITSIPEAYQEYTSVRGNILGPPLTWLDWMLFRGAKRIVVGSRFSQRLTGRSGLKGIMIDGGSWRVPTNFAGTIKNNFITRLLESRSREINNGITTIIDRNLVTSGRRAI